MVPLTNSVESDRSGKNGTPSRSPRPSVLYVAICAYASDLVGMHCAAVYDSSDICSPSDLILGVRWVLGSLRNYEIKITLHLVVITGGLISGECTFVRYYM